MLLCCLSRPREESKPFYQREESKAFYQRLSQRGEQSLLSMPLYEQVFRYGANKAVIGSVAPRLDHRQ